MWMMPCLSWQLVSWLHLLLLFSWVDSLLQVRPAFPMKDLLLSEGVMAQEDSVWRNGGKSPLFPGKRENNIFFFSSLQCSRGNLSSLSIYTLISYCFYVKSLGEQKKLLE